MRDDRIHVHGEQPMAGASAAWRAFVEAFVR